MEDEIKVGEYVRTVKQGIKRIDTIFENRPVNRYGYEVGSDWAGKEYSIIKTTDIVKHSEDIIDLIEVRRLCKWEICIFYWNSNRKFTYNKSYRWNIYP